MKKQNGFTLVEIVVWAALAALIIVVFLSPSRTPVSADDIKRLTGDAQSVPKLSAEWKDVLREHPTPTASDIRFIRKAIEAVAAARESTKVTGTDTTAIEAKIVSDYFKSKQDRENVKVTTN